MLRFPWRLVAISGEVPTKVYRKWKRTSDFASFFYIVLNAPRKQMASKYVHFLGFCMDPTNFRFKIHEISVLGTKCYLNVAKSAPDMKIMEFCKVLPGRAQNANFHVFLKSSHRGFSVIFIDFTILRHFSISF